MCSGACSRSIHQVLYKEELQTPSQERMRDPQRSTQLWHRVKHKVGKNTEKSIGETKSNTCMLPPSSSGRVQSQQCMVSCVFRLPSNEEVRSSQVAAIDSAVTATTRGRARYALAIIIVAFFGTFLESLNQKIKTNKKA